MMIDFHTHIVPPQVKENRTRYTQRDRAFASVYADPKAKLATADELIASMDKHGIEQSVVLNYGWETQKLSVEVNDYILESMVRYRGRLVGFCNAPVAAGDNALKEIERCLDAGARGVGEIRPDLIPPAKRLEMLKPLAVMMVNHEAILLTHSSEPVGHEYPGKGKATPDMLYEIITAFPDLKIVCAHWGGGLPFYALMPEVKAALKNVYFDTAASPFLYQPEIYKQAVRLVGEDKILFGTDYPLIPPSRYFKEIDSLELPNKRKEKILGGNAAKLLGTE